MNIIKSFATVVISIIVTIISLEAMLWLFHLPPYPETVYSGYKKDDQNGFVLRPNTILRHSSWEYDETVTVNNYSIRHQKDLNNDASVYAFVLGDSFANGYGVGDSETISANIERAKNKIVLNLGVGSYSTYQATNLYKRYLEKFKNPPKFAILVFYIGNDFYDNRRFVEFFQTTGNTVQTSSNGYVVERGTEVIRSGQNLEWQKNGNVKLNKPDPGFYLPESYKNFLFDWSKTYNAFIWFIKDKKMNCQIPIAVPGLLNSVFSLQDSDEWRLTKKALDEFKNVSTTNVITPILAIIPCKYQLAPELIQAAGCNISEINTDESVNLLVEWANQNNVLSIDLLNYYRSLSVNQKKKLFYRVDSHLTAYGNKITASAIISVLD